MRRFVIVGFSLALSLAVPVWSLGEGLGLSDFRILIEGQSTRSLRPLQQLSEVLDMLGKPGEIREKTDSHYAGTVFVEWSYEGCKVVFGKGGDNAEAFFVTRPSYSTPRGIRVGDSEQKVTISYGKGEEEQLSTMDHYLRYHVDIPSSDPVLGVNYFFLSFLIKAHAVAEIGISVVSQGAD